MSEQSAQSVHYIKLFGTVTMLEPHASGTNSFVYDIWLDLDHPEDSCAVVSGISRLAGVSASSIQIRDNHRNKRECTIEFTRKIPQGAGPQEERALSSHREVWHKLTTFAQALADHRKNEQRSDQRTTKSRPGRRNMPRQVIVANVA